MSVEPQVRSGRREGTSRRAKVQPITMSDNLLSNGLPSDSDAERFVLGSLLLDGGRFSEVAILALDDFSLDRHRRVFSAMRELHDAGESIDYITVADRLKHRNEHSQDDLSFLTELGV